MRKIIAALALVVFLPALGYTFFSAVTFHQKEKTGGSMKEDVLAVHNRYRAELGTPPLIWSETLEARAKEWANHLASSGGQLRHSYVSGEGENLWKGTAERFSHSEKVEYWAQRKKYFKGGIFPHVSTTGNWLDVGHYTQMIWYGTTHVGCAQATSGTHDIFVCRYAPAGNIFGQKHNALHQAAR